ncbi:MOSC domain-containing protein [Paenibacillus luteus]|uniref:MOSC domain-containing protein n=1 Tax=Paenibacillus luteus TaxID=2545753 RepID=UPI0011449CC2|nr:MOSC domain-containing protein [Paenibacillus luteus]
MTRAVGEISEIRRYPVKSFAGEQLNTCKIDSYGIYGDRFCAFYDETKEGWDSFFTARKSASMLTYQASLIGETVKVKGPDGRSFSWNEELLSEIQLLSKQKLSMKSCRAPNPENPELMSVDLGSILIITDTSLRKLEDLWGKALDHRRFRANFLIRLSDNSFDEGYWIGKQLEVGDAALQVDQHCERCSMITLDPDSLERDASLLKRVNEELNLKFGVYASVKQTGNVRNGDKVYIK